MLINSSVVTVPKTSFINIPLLIALLITSAIHFLLISKITIELPEIEIEKNQNTVVVTLVKPKQPHKQTRKPHNKPVAKKTFTQSSKHHTDLTSLPKAKKHDKVHRPAVQRISPDVVTSPKIEIAANIPVIEPKIEAAPVVPIEPPPITPVIPEPKVDVIAPETALVAEQTKPASADVIEKPVELPEKSSKKSRKKSGKKRSSGIDSNQTPLSMDDLALQIAQVGEKFANQVPTASENRIKTLDSVRRHKTSARQYKQDWRQKIERIANLNFPEAARQKDFSAKVVVEVGINADGSIHSLRIKKSSGTPALDQAAKNIVQMGTPFAPLPKDLAEELDVLIIQQPMLFSDESGVITQ